MFENKRDSVSDETRADTYYTGLITAGTLSPAELDRYNELAYSVCLLVRTTPSISSSLYHLQADFKELAL